jgi:hypothetical protein
MSRGEFIILGGYDGGENELDIKLDSIANALANTDTRDNVSGGGGDATAGTITVVVGGSYSNKATDVVDNVKTDNTAFTDVKSFILKYMDNMRN